MAIDMAQGYLCLVLHAHLPYVRHPEYDSFYEETWLFEAISETYFPLLWGFEQLAQEGIAFRLCVSLSPTLTAMLQDPVLQQRYRSHLDKLLVLTQAEARRCQGTPAAALVELYRQHWQRCRKEAEGDLLARFVQLSNSGQVELITCAATHAYLPLWQQQPNLVNAQLTVAKHSHQKLTGRAPVGIWLPECGYYPGLENHLRDLGIGYFFVDTHACEHASEPARYAHYAPLRCPNGVVALPRDPGCSQQVWSADSGYPGDGDYRDFYRDIGVELERALLGDFLAPQHPPIPTGLKYYAITDKHSPAALKRWYDPARAQHKALLHAEDFYQSCCRRVREQSQHMSLPPLLVAPYDAELFGHWWFEGPQWLMQVIRLCHQSEHLTLLSPGDYIARHGKQLQIAVPSTSSWGESGYHQVWLNPRNDFLYPPLLQAGKRLQHLLTTFSPADSLSQRYLTQAIRAFLLAQASDWPFMLKNGAGADYAQQRFQTQLGRFHYLCECLENNNVDDLSTLESLEAQENLFPQLDYQVFA